MNVHFVCRDRNNQPSFDYFERDVDERLYERLCRAQCHPKNRVRISGKKLEYRVLEFDKLEDGSIHLVLIEAVPLH